MNWQLVLMTNIIIFAVAQVLIKLIVGKLPKAQALSLQFLINALIMFSFVLAKNQFHFSDEALKVIPLGVLASLGAYCQWKAIAVSLSRTALFLPLAGSLTVGLAALFLGETKEWSSGLMAGIIICFLAAFFFRNQSKEKAEGNRESDKKWLFFVVGMILIFGITNFLMKAFSSDIPRGQFLFYWYAGTFLGSLPLLFLEKQNPLEWPGRIVFLVPLASLAILGNLATQYWAFQLTLASRVVPFQTFGTTFVPVLIGWFVFKERKGLSKKELLAFFTGLAGASLIILS